MRHIEHHFTASQSVRDIVIGMSDGLTVPFALAAGLSGVAVDTKIIVTAGIAEIAAGAIAMGLGGYLAAKVDVEHFAAERQREEREAVEMPDEERAEVAQIFRGYGLDEPSIAAIVARISGNRDRWVDFMMRFELGLEEPDSRRARTSAWTIALSYVVGGLVPLVPYMLSASPENGLIGSILLTLAALLVFGYIKGLFTTARPIRSAVQTMLVGGIAAGAAFLLAKFVG